MKKLRFLLFFLALFSISDAISQKTCDYNNRSVFFGERSVELTQSKENVLRIYLDKNGSFYPNTFIRDKDLKRNCSSISEWLKNNPFELKSLCNQYQVDNGLTIEVKIQKLDIAIAKENLLMINNKIQDYDCVNILIHGFRKKVYGDIDSSASYSDDDNLNLETKLSNNVDKRILFIEVYWDSKFITPIQSYRFKRFELFEQAAIPNAINVGLALRQIIPHINNQNINIISHSLGAQVACELLYNSSEERLNNENIFSTPSQSNIRICLIAPAISCNKFNNYYLRNTVYDYTKQDNYLIAIVYNSNDFVLQKQYGYGVNALPTEYGDTSLGCNYSEDVEKFKTLFKNEFTSTNTPLTLNFSINNDGVGMACHLINCYLTHQDFGKVKDFLYN